MLDSKNWYKKKVTHATKNINILKKKNPNQFPFGFSQIVEMVNNSMHETLIILYWETIILCSKIEIVEVFHMNFIYNIFNIHTILKCSFTKVKCVPIRIVWPLFRKNKMKSRWLLIRLYGWCINFVLPLSYILLPSFMYVSEPIQWFCIHVKRSDAFESWEISSYYGHEQNHCCIHIYKRDREIEREREWEWKIWSMKIRSIEWCTELMTWQSSSIKYMAMYWHCSRQVFHTIFTDSI